MKILIADGSGALQAEDFSSVLAAGGNEIQILRDGIVALRVARAWWGLLTCCSRPCTCHEWTGWR